VGIYILLNNNPFKEESILIFMKAERYQTGNQGVIETELTPEHAGDLEVLQAMKKYGANGADIRLRLEHLRIAKDAQTTEEMRFEYCPNSVPYHFVLTSDHERERMVLGLMRGHTMMDSKITLKLDSSGLPSEKKAGDETRLTFERQTRQPFQALLEIMNAYGLR